MRGLAAGFAAAVALLLVGGCSASPPPDLVRRTAPEPTPSDAKKPCTRAPAPATGGSTDGATDGGPVAATFDRASNTIHLTRGQNVTMTALRQAVGTDAALRRTAPGEWYLAANLEIDQGATMRVAAPETRWLKLRSVDTEIATETGLDKVASVTVAGGGLAIDGSCVTSWDDAKGSADTSFKNPRSFLLARAGTMTIDNADLSYLGYGNLQSYGLSWRNAGTTGHLVNSNVSYLFYGVYTFAVDGFVISGNDVHNNVLYGVDPHTGSKNLKIQNNTVHDNGKHGIILAEECTDSVISGNVVYRNQHHGIVLYEKSDNNVVENNDTFLNAAQGININQANDNTVTGNRSYDNEDSGIGLGQSNQNTVKGNDIRGNKVDGIRLVTGASDNTLSDNLIGQNARYGLYVDSKNPFTLSGNTIWNNRAAVLLKGTTQPTQIGNSMFGNQIEGVKSE